MKGLHSSSLLTTISAFTRKRNHKPVSLSEEDSFVSINRIAAALYAPYIEKFIGRELNDIEVSTLEGLRGTKA
jgi:hypothetical protein